MPQMLLNKLTGFTETPVGPGRPKAATAWITVPKMSYITTGKNVAHDGFWMITNIVEVKHLGTYVRAKVQLIEYRI